MTPEPNSPTQGAESLKEQCDDCEGSGLNDDRYAGLCSTCDGSGEVVSPTPTEGELETLIAREIAEYEIGHTWGDDDASGYQQAIVDRIPHWRMCADDIVALINRNALSRTPGSMEGEAYDRLRRFAGSAEFGGESGNVVYPGGIFQTGGLNTFYADLRALLALSQPRPASTPPVEEGCAFCLPPQYSHLIRRCSDCPYRPASTLPGDGALPPADEAQMALCQLDWVESLPGVHPHRVKTIRLALERLALTSPPPGVDASRLGLKLYNAVVLVAHGEGHSWTLKAPDFFEAYRAFQAALAPAPQSKGGE